MFKALFGSLIGKITSFALLVAGLTGGMAATGELPGFVSFTSENPSVQQSSQTGIALDFPSSVLAQKAPEPVVVETPPAPAEVIVEVAAPVAAAAPAPKAPPQCVGQIQGLVTGLVNGIQGITSAEQAQAMLAQAGSIAEATQGCAAQSTAAGNLGLDQLVKLTEQLILAVGQIQALPIVSAGSPLDGLATNPVGTITTLVGVGLEKTLGVVNTGLGMLLSPLN
ncbi:MAG: hypothetical protein WD627_02470 [Actinomycetota bacterium]